MSHDLRRLEADAKPNASSAVVARIVAVGTLFAVCAVFVQTLVHLANSFLLSDGTQFRYTILNPDTEGAPFQWASISATFACAFGAGLLAITRDRGRVRLFVLSGALALLSLDDALSVHEDIQKVFERNGLSPGLELWPFLLGPLLALVFLLLLQLGRELDRTIRTPLLAGLALLVVALGAEIFVRAIWWFSGRPHVLDVINLGLEEGAELGGWLLLATAIGAAACAAFIELGDDDRDREATISPRT